jgi:hypothetical protein
VLHADEDLLEREGDAEVEVSETVVVQRQHRARLESPNTRVTNQNHERGCTNHKEWGDKESLKGCARLKSCESLYTCPRAPLL